MCISRTSPGGAQRLTWLTRDEVRRIAANIARIYYAGNHRMPDQAETLRTR
jgi:hypothetical protein